MLWFSVWTVLIVATLVGAFLLARSLYRSGRALLAEIARGGDLLGQVADRAAELAAAADAGAAPAPVSLTDPEPARARRAAAVTVREQRRAGQAAVHAAVQRRWQSFSR